MIKPLIFNILLVTVFVNTIAANTLPDIVKEGIERLEKDFDLDTNELAIIIDPAVQTLFLVKNNSLEKSYAVSTGKAGIGCKRGSGKTPFGVHRISEKYGDGAALGAIFKSRANTNKTAKIYIERTDILEDDITTRILWLDGQEKNTNKGGKVDSRNRYIYIHGTPEEGLIGEPASQGCVRMKNVEVIKLFDRVPCGTLVLILNREYEGVMDSK